MSLSRNGNFACTSTLFAVLCSLLSCTGAPPAPEMPSGPHPILVVDIESLRADHLGCYGSRRRTSPNLDALATESVRFEWTFSQAPSPGPSQASIFSGLYPTTHGMRDETTRLADEVVTLAEVLSENGYTTAAFVDGGYVSEDFGFAQGFKFWDNSRGAGIRTVGAKALQWLRDHGEENFLLLIHASDPHVPYAPPEPYRSLFLAGLESPSEGFEPDPEILGRFCESLHGDQAQPLSSADLEYAKALYDGEIRLVDDFLGELMTGVRELGLDERATILFLSDHGEEFMEHGDLLHRQIYTTVTRIPLLIRLPHGQHAGTIERFVEAVDVMPTLLDLAAAPAPSLIQGDSLVPLILGPPEPPYVAFGRSHFDGEQRFVALAGRRLIVTGESGRAELYDLFRDPLELHDIAASEPEQVAQMMKRLADWEATVRNTVLSDQQASDIDQETLEQLRGLGYIQ